MAYTKEGTDGQILRSSKWIVIVIMIFEKKWIVIVIMIFENLSWPYSFSKFIL